MSDNAVDYPSGAAQCRLDDMSQWQVETSRRLVAIELHIAGVRRDIVLDAEDATNAQERMDALAERVARIERRLELAPLDNEKVRRIRAGIFRGVIPTRWHATVREAVAHADPGADQATCLFGSSLGERGQRLL